MQAIYKDKWYDFILVEDTDDRKIYHVDTNEETWGKSRIGACAILRASGVDPGISAGEYSMAIKFHKLDKNVRFFHRWEYKPEINPIRMILTITRI